MLDTIAMPDQAFLVTCRPGKKGERLALAEGGKIVGLQPGEEYWAEVCFLGEAVRVGTLALSVSYPTGRRGCSSRGGSFGREAEDHLQSKSLSVPLHRQ